MLKKKYLISIFIFVTLAFIMMFSGIYTTHAPIISTIKAVKLYFCGDKSNKLFVQELVKHPKYTGAIAPSSKSLSEAITSYVTHGSQVVEVGAGTGVFTEFLVKKTDKIYIIENNKDFYKLLKEKFPHRNVILGDATLLEQYLPQDMQFDFVVSGLPLTIFDEKSFDKIIKSYIKILKPKGAILQFTYRKYPPIDAAKYGLRAKCMKYVPDNLPPAYVWQYTKKTHQLP